MKNILLTSLLLAAALTAQNNDPSNDAIWSFSEAGSIVGCPANHPRMDPSTQPGCYLPPYNCPPPTVRAQHYATIQWDRVSPNSLTILLASYAWEPQNGLGPCVIPGASDIVGVKISDNSGVLQFTFNLPTEIPPGMAGYIGPMQLFSVDQNLQLISSSNVINVWAS